MGVYSLKETKTLEGLVLDDKIYDISFVQEVNKTKVYTITKELENHPTIVETPKTGDESNLKLWISLFVVSFIILAILIYKFKKNYILNKNMYNFLDFLYIFIEYIYI